MGGEELLQSSDSVADLIADRSETQHGRVERWLLPASAAEIAELWRGVADENFESNTLHELIMARWTAPDPQGAVAASRGSRRELIPWRYWGKADPEGAMAAAAGEPVEAGASVLRGIGEVDSALAVGLLEGHPGVSHYSAIDGITRGLSQTDLQSAVEFARRPSREGDAPLTQWAERDPDALLAWMTKNELGVRLSYGGRDALFALARKHPHRIEELTDSLPSGGVRAGLLVAGIRQLAKVDYEAAAALVERARGMGMGSTLYAELGRALVHQDLDRSLELLRDSRTYNEAPVVSLSYPGGAARVKPASREFIYWAEQLAEQRPRETMEAVEGRRDLEIATANTWMARDVMEFSDWLEAAENFTSRDSVIASLTDTLRDSLHDDYPLALQWSLQMNPGQHRDENVWQVVATWMHEVGARDLDSFLQSIEAPEEAREAYESHRARALGQTPGD